MYSSWSLNADTNILGTKKPSPTPIKFAEVPIIVEKERSVYANQFVVTRAGAL